MPAASAAAGSARRTGRPRTRIRRTRAGFAPISASALDVRPEPTRPAKPRISPSRSAKRFTGPFSRTCSASTSSTGAASRARRGFGGKLCSMRRPTIISTSAPTSVRATSVVPTYCPSRSTVIRSHTSKISSRWCEMKIIATPRRLSSRITPNRCAASAGVSVAVGSSRISSRASSDSALPISTNCCCATDSSRTGADRSIATSSRAKMSAAARRIRARSRSPSRPRHSRPRNRLSTAFSSGIRLNS